jgi:HPt (histidine-containing phosphotransfer) domain-containing protein
MTQLDANYDDSANNAMNALSSAEVASRIAGTSKSVNTGMKIQRDDLPIHREFITESREHLAVAESKLLALEANPEDTEAIDAIFRCFHTIKGVAGFLNLKQVGKLVPQPKT